MQGFGSEPQSEEKKKKGFFSRGGKKEDKNMGSSFSSNPAVPSVVGYGAGQRPPMPRVGAGVTGVYNQAQADMVHSQTLHQQRGAQRALPEMGRVDPSLQEEQERRRHAAAAARRGRPPGAGGARVCDGDLGVVVGGWWRWRRWGGQVPARGAQQPPPLPENDDDADLKRAIELSRREAEEEAARNSRAPTMSFDSPPQSRPQPQPQQQQQPAAFQQGNSPDLFGMSPPQQQRRRSSNNNRPPLRSGATTPRSMRSLVRHQ